MKIIRKESGKINIVLLDSGIDRHRDLDRYYIKDNIYFEFKDNEFVKSSDCIDQSGHGTSVASIIFDKVSDVDIISIKILDENNTSTSEIFLKALEYISKLNVDIINISLGVESNNKKNAICELCYEMIGKNVVIVAAGNTKNKVVLPADIDGVVKVMPGIILNNNIYKYKNYFIAQGIPRLLPSINNKYTFIGGSSIATPNITSLIANIIKNYNTVNYNEILSILNNNSYKVLNNNIHSKQFAKNKLYIKQDRYKVLDKISMLIINILNISNNIELKSNNYNKILIEKLEFLNKKRLLPINLTSINIFDFNYIKKNLERKLFYE